MGAAVIVCGWCGNPTIALDRCGSCGHVDPARPWRHRGEEPPALNPSNGRPALDEHAIRQRYAEAQAAIRASGAEPTVESLAEQLDRSPRTVREWRKRYGLH